MVVYPSSLRWIIFDDRDFDWSVLNCMSRETCSRFAESCGSSYVRTVGEILPFLPEMFGEGDHAKLEQTVAALLRNYDG